ncbi:MAG: tryptophan-rich sensory protein [Candidatus Thorarchaeota archaeon]|nr:MAG: tryptophan-rich sensory protein [Candidatus Thorarchaeota archaeon]
MTNTNPKVLQIVNLLAIISTIIFNALVNIIPLNGVTSGEVSDFYPSLFTPPGYVFSIWGVIYTLLGIFIVYQLRSSQREMDYLQEISFLYLIGAVFNISWLILFHYSYGVASLFVFTPLFIVGLLVVLLFTYVRLGIGIKHVTRGVKLAVHLPVSVYLGWISLATIANTASVLNEVIVGIPLAVQEMWTSAVLVIALILSLLMLVLRRDFAFNLVVIWASVGIATKQAASLLIYGTALGVAIILAIAIVVLPLVRKRPFGGFYIEIVE